MQKVKQTYLHDHAIIQRSKLGHVFLQTFGIHIPWDSKNLNGKPNAINKTFLEVEERKLKTHFDQKY